MPETSQGSLHQIPRSAFEPNAWEESFDSVYLTHKSVVEGSFCQRWLITVFARGKLAPETGKGCLRQR
jgi:hypothetical protein